MQHIWTVVCRESIIDSRSNNISMISVIERVTFAELVESEFIPLDVEVISSWYRSDFNIPEKNQARVLILAPNGEQVGDALNYDVDLTEYTRLRSQGKIWGLPYHGDGIYHLVIEMYQNDTWEIVSDTPLEIIKENTPST